jgi:hypothetical protein
MIKELGQYVMEVNYVLNIGRLKAKTVDRSSCIPMTLGAYFN